MQRVPNSGQSVGRRRPCRTRPARHSAGSATAIAPHVEDPLGVERGEVRRERVAAHRDLAEAAPAAVGHDEHLADHLQRRHVPLAHDRPRVLVLDPRLAALELGDRGEDALQQVEGLEAGHDDRDAVARGDRLVVGVAGHGADVARSQESLDLRVLARQERLESRWHEHVRDEHGEVREALGGGAVDGHGVRRGRRLEADREEDDLAVGVLPGEAHRVERRVDDPHVAAARLDLQQVVARAGHAQHVAEGAEGHVGTRGDRDRAIDQVERRHAHRAARAVHEADARRQELVQPELQDGSASGRRRPP